MKRVTTAKTYTFDDVCLVPQYSNVPSRTIPNLGSWITKHHRIDIPILASNMDTVIGTDLAHVFIEKGSIPIFHRFASIDKQIKWVNECHGQCFLSCGFQDADVLMDTLTTLKNDMPLGICIDVAHGHCERMLALIRKWKNTFPHLDVIAGNVCTPMGYSDLVNAGADAVKVGVGPGSVCLTRMVTGFGVSQFSAIYECAEMAQKLRVPIIADGGINTARDVSLAIAAGASTVMMGKLFAKTIESEAPKKLAGAYRYLTNVETFQLMNDKNKTKNVVVRYRGQASKCFQEDFYGTVKEGTCPEGVDFWTECTGSARDLIDTFCASLRSSLTYGGAKDIKEFQRKAEFRIVSSTYRYESNTRPE